MQHYNEKQEKIKKDNMLMGIPWSSTNTAGDARPSNDAGPLMMMWTATLSDVNFV